MDSAANDNEWIVWNVIDATLLSLDDIVPLDPALFIDWTLSGGSYTRNKIKHGRYSYRPINRIRLDVCPADVK